MRLYFRYELIVYIDMCFTSCVLLTYEYNELKCVDVYIYIYIYIYINLNTYTNMFSVLSFVIQTTVW